MGIGKDSSKSLNDKFIKVVSKNRNITEIENAYFELRDKIIEEINKTGKCEYLVDLYTYVEKILKGSKTGINNINWGGRKEVYWYEYNLVREIEKNITGKSLLGKKTNFHATDGISDYSDLMKGIYNSIDYIYIFIDENNVHNDRDGEITISGPDDYEKNLRDFSTNGRQMNMTDSNESVFKPTQNGQMNSRVPTGVAFGTVNDINMANAQNNRIDAVNEKANRILWNADKEKTRILQSAREEADRIKSVASKEAEKKLFEAKSEAKRITDDALAEKDRAEKEREYAEEQRNKAINEAESKAKERAGIVFRESLREEMRLERDDINDYLRTEKESIKKESVIIAEINKAAIKNTNNIQAELMTRIDDNYKELNSIIMNFKEDFYKQLGDWQKNLYINEEKPIADVFVELYEKVNRNSDKILGTSLENDGEVDTNSEVYKFIKAIKMSVQRMEQALRGLGLEVVYPKVGDDFDEGNHEIHNDDVVYSNPVVKTVISPAVQRRVNEEDTILIRKAVVEVVEKSEDIIME